MFKFIILAITLFTKIVCARETILQNATPEQITKGFQRQNQEYTSTSRTMKPVPNESPTPPQLVALSFVINFEFDSSSVKKESYKILQNISEAFNSPKLVKSSFIIEGHTDVVGDPEYNMALSRRRAESVRSFLISKGINPNRLKAIGKGSKELNDPSDPTGASNRRVKIIRLD